MQPDLKRLPSLDGWRAVSILMVLGGHCVFTVGFPSEYTTLVQWIFDGNLGVRFFFVISGFLITWLMMLEHDQCGRVSLKAFYVRRALRILPVYYAFLLTIALIQYFTPFFQGALSWFGNLTFTTNFISSEFTTDHLWSLSTEEQFYLLWPGLFVLFSVATRWKSALWLLAIPLVVAPVSRVMGYTGHPALLYPLTRHFSFFSFFDSLAVGCGAAILFARERDKVMAFIRSKPALTLAVGLLLVLVPHVLMRLRWPRYFMIPFGTSLQAFGFAVLLLQSVTLPRWGFYPVLNWRVATQIGVLSYSLYVWQGIFYTRPEVLGVGPVWWLSFPTWLVPVCVVSVVSYYGFERPLLKLRARFRKT